MSFQGASKPDVVIPEDATLKEIVSKYTGLRAHVPMKVGKTRADPEGKMRWITFRDDKNGVAIGVDEDGLAVVVAGNDSSNVVWRKNG